MFDSPTPAQRDAFCDLSARLDALHADLAVQSRAAKAGPAPATAVRLARAMQGEAVKCLKEWEHKGPLPAMPGPKAPMAELLTALGQLRAMLSTLGRRTGLDTEPPSLKELDPVRAYAYCLRLAQVVCLGIEEGVEARMAAIEKGEDPEEAYNIVHTYHYQLWVKRAREEGVEITEPAPRLATHPHLVGRL